ncbi:hypothetical protein CFK38_01690 [Brachybacterium vulturis]|uniref:Uncharacterized protein n=1 Tax=Brachybacterium vulturis TaxID=2017484 RepID=A0A291GJZ9_9MICO|nr:hypothetical protein [Brachybacterium vulturis]ATG50376.1 hypothetical protein CFK38_01690 [Brachybacterium vulturis]
MSTPGEKWSTPGGGQSTPDEERSTAAPDDGPAEAGRGDAPAPLTSLSTLLGGSFEGGATCAADGTCD